MTLSHPITFISYKKSEPDPVLTGQTRFHNLGWIRLFYNRQLINNILSAAQFIDDKQYVTYVYIDCFL